MDESNEPPKHMLCQKLLFRMLCLTCPWVGYPHGFPTKYFIGKAPFTIFWGVEKNFISSSVVWHVELLLILYQKRWVCKFPNFLGGDGFFSIHDSLSLIHLISKEISICCYLKTFSWFIHGFKCRHFHRHVYIFMGLTSTWEKIDISILL